MIDPVVRAIYYFMLLESHLPESDTHAIVEMLKVQNVLTCVNNIGTPKEITKQDVIDVLLQHLREKANE